MWRYFHWTHCGYFTLNKSLLLLIHTAPYSILSMLSARQGSDMYQLFWGAWCHLMVSPGPGFEPMTSRTPGEHFTIELPVPVLVLILVIIIIIIIMQEYNCTFFYSLQYISTLICKIEVPSWSSDWAPTKLYIYGCSSIGWKMQPENNNKAHWLMGKANNELLC